MADSKTAMTTPGKIKIQRTRKRLYEELDQAPLDQAPLDQAPSINQQMRYAKSRRVVDYHAALASTAGFIPMPVVDMLAISALQLKLIRDLSKLYDITFSKQRAKAITAALIGGVQTGLISSSASKYIPAVGALATIPTAIGAGAITYAVGRVFIYHFEIGGTLLDFNADKLRAYFQQQLNQKSVKTTKVKE